MAVAHNDARHDVLTIVTIRNSHHRCIENRRVAQQRFVDLARRNIFATLDDQFLDAAGDKEKTISDRGSRDPRCAASRREKMLQPWRQGFCSSQASPAAL